MEFKSDTEILNFIAEQGMLNGIFPNPDDDEDGFTLESYTLEHGCTIKEAIRRVMTEYMNTFTEDTP